MRRLSVLVFATLLLPIAGCDTDRLAQFGAFAAAGAAYVTAFHTFAQDAGTVFIAADSAGYIAARQITGADTISQDPAIYTHNLVVSDAQMQQYLSNLDKLERHADLLGAYFAAVTQITDGKASSATVASLDSLADAIDSLAPSIETISFGGKSVKDVANTVSSAVIAHFQVKALNQNLQKHGKIIEKALALQGAAIEVLTTQIQSSIAASLKLDEARIITIPYVSNGPLPSSWVADRDAFLRKKTILESAESASAAIKALQSDFAQLEQNPYAKIDLASLIKALGDMAGYASAAQTAATK